MCRSLAANWGILICSQGSIPPPPPPGPPSLVPDEEGSFPVLSGQSYVSKVCCLLRTLFLIKTTQDSNESLFLIVLYHLHYFILLIYISFKHACIFA